MQWLTNVEGAMSSWLDRFMSRAPLGVTTRPNGAQLEAAQSERQSSLEQNSGTTSNHANVSIDNRIKKWISDTYSVDFDTDTPVYPMIHAYKKTVTVKDVRDQALSEYKNIAKVLYQPDPRNGPSFWNVWWSDMKSQVLKGRHTATVKTDHYKSIESELFKAVEDRNIDGIIKQTRALKKFVNETIQGYWDYSKPRDVQWVMSERLPFYNLQKIAMGQALDACNSVDDCLKLIKACRWKKGYYENIEVKDRGTRLPEASDLFFPDIVAEAALKSKNFPATPEQRAAVKAELTSLIQDIDKI
jgi:hypothetical protein